MSASTKNMKDNRKIVRVQLYAPELIFKIPDGLVLGSWLYPADEEEVQKLVEDLVDRLEVDNDQLDELLIQVCSCVLAIPPLDLVPPWR